MTQCEYLAKMSVLSRKCAQQYVFQGAECLAEIQIRQHQAMEQQLADMSTMEKQTSATVNQLQVLERQKSLYSKLVRESGGEPDLKTMDVWDHPNDLSYEYHKTITGQNRTKGGD